MTESLLAATIPVEVLVRGRRCVVVGGGHEAESKVRRLLAAGARVEWFDETRTDEGAADPGVTTLATAPTASELEGAAVVFLSTAFEELGARAAETARARGTLVCTLDRPEHATFVNPAVVDGAGVRLAISTGGASPALAKRLREELGRLFSDPALGAFVDRLAQARARLPRGQRGSLQGSAAGLRLEGRWLVPPDDGGS
jgi:precorrin-2 dehydrogenase/sirohydrochlorin ferrochelatase